MSGPTQQPAGGSVFQSITVKASAKRAFDIFTEGMDSWWPREHHIGKAPMTRTAIEGRLGGRCYSEHTDGTQCDWGRIVVWEPPRRLVMAWMIGANWQHEADIEKCSEVEVRFTELGESTRVDLEHRNFERMGAAGAAMRKGVDSPRGWVWLLNFFREKAER